jgi:carbon storage regulator
MLVLTRKRRESVLVGDAVRITVVEVGRSTVRIGIEAPSGVTVLREELVLDAEDQAAKAAWEAGGEPALPA